MISRTTHILIAFSAIFSSFPSFADDSNSLQQLNTQIQTEIKQLQDLQNQQLNKVNTQIQGQLTTLNTQVQTQIKQVQQQLEAEVQKMNSQFQDQIKQLQTNTAQQINTLQQEIIELKKK